MKKRDNRHPSTPEESRRGRKVPAQPSADEQSGSNGRRTDAKDLDPTKDTGQGRYGQSGYGRVRRVKE